LSVSTLDPRHLPTLKEIRQERARRSLAYFVEATVAFKLDAWQHILCRRLSRLATETGQRILVHAPPQIGKSIIVSQRFPAWLLARRPGERIKLAAYNITHATRFARIIRDLMQSREYAELFPDPGLRIPALASAEEWTTAKRSTFRDAQPSFKALGLLTGFVGQGADTLIVDDPYSSPQDAASETIRASVWDFWDATARVRLNDNSNVVVMFHRYHEDDLAGRLWAEGGWEMLRFPAEWDGDPEWPDPLARDLGERLSPRLSDEFLAEQKRSPLIWLGQFQGRPTNKEGLFFKVDRFEFIEAAPKGLRMVRAWDFAATAGAGNYTAGVKMGIDHTGRYYVLDVRRDQWSTDDVDRQVLLAARLDGKMVKIHGPQDPGAAGKKAALAFVRLLAGFGAKTEPVSGDKAVRATPFSSQVNAGNVTLVRGDWNRAFIEELRVFPRGKNDDQVDAAADAFNELSPPAPRGSRSGGQRPSLAAARQQLLRGVPVSGPGGGIPGSGA
jgi:predicted phage terminase large subunit-like protein